MAARMSIAVIRDIPGGFRAGPGAAGLGDMRGEEYGAVYAGLNWFLRGHKLKLMAGVEYARMNDRAGDGGDYEGWTLFTGVRLHF